MGRTPSIPWEELVALKDTGLSDREIAEQCGTSRQAISTRLKRGGWKKGQATNVAPQATKEQQMLPPSEPAKKPPPADEKGGGNTPIELRMELDNKQAQIDRLDRALSLALNRIGEIEAARAPDNQPGFTDAVNIIEEMFDYLGGEDTATELGDIARQTVYGWYERKRIPGWVHDIGWSDGVD